MGVQGGWAFFYGRGTPVGTLDDPQMAGGAGPLSSSLLNPSLRGRGCGCLWVQGYLAHKKTLTPRTLQQAYMPRGAYDDGSRVRRVFL